MNTKLKSAIIASILLNVLLLGVLFGRLSPGFGGENSRRERLTAQIEKLPEPARSRFRDKLSQFRSADDPAREQMRQARNEAIRLLVAEPFHEAAYDQQVLKMTELRRQRTQRMSDGMKELIKGLPPEQRTAVGEMLKRPTPPPR